MKQAAFALVIENHRILLTLRKDVPLWVLPGGGIEEGENPEEAALRELLEETGLEGRIIRKTHTLSPVNRLTQPTHLFLVEGTGKLLHDSDESWENRFFPLSGLPNNMFWVHKLWVEEALQGTETITRPLNEVSWTNFLSYFVRHPWQVLRFIGTLLTK